MKFCESRLACGTPQPPNGLPKAVNQVEFPVKTTGDGVALVTVNGTAVLVTPFTTAVTLTWPAGRVGTVTVTELTAQVVTVAFVVPKNTALDPCVLPNEFPIPGIIVIELPDTPAAGLTHAICNGAELTAGATVSETEVVAVADPEVPVIVTVDVPASAVALAVSVRTSLPEVGFVANDAVTPLGNPDAARVTLPVNPFPSTTDIVSVALAPLTTDKVLADEESVKLPVEEPPPDEAPLQATPLSVNAVGTALTELFHVPVNPTPVTLPPAGMLPSKDAFVTVTFAPLCVSVPFQS
jgi:hypothetical protein